jgi:large subunit ribosomal protein L29
MATKRYIELQSMAVEAIEEELQSAKSDLNRMAFDHKSKGLSDPGQLRLMKKEIARLQTELRARELSAMSPEQVANRSKIRARRK